MTKIIEFPKTEYILRCGTCKSNAFYIYLEGNDPHVITGYECTECGDRWQLDDIEIRSCD